MINHYQGGSLQAVSGHVGVRHIITGSLIGGEGREVNSFHDQGIVSSSLGKGLEIVASSEDSIVEAISHQDLPWLGIMWHPEREERVAREDSSLFRATLE
jgi:putative glutamine amidotransferase